MIKFYRLKFTIQRKENNKNKMMKDMNKIELQPNTEKDSSVKGENSLKILLKPKQN